MYRKGGKAYKILVGNPGEETKWEDLGGEVRTYKTYLNPLNGESNPICHPLPL